MSDRNNADDDEPKNPNSSNTQGSDSHDITGAASADAISFEDSEPASRPDRELPIPLRDDDFFRLLEMAAPLPVDEETWLSQQQHGSHHEDSLIDSDSDAGESVETSLNANERSSLNGVPNQAIVDPRLDLPSGRPSDLDLEVDPLLRLEESHSSFKTAVIFALCIPALTVLTGIAIAVVSRIGGGPICDSGYATWICSRTYEILFPVLPGVISFSGLVAAGVVCYQKWRHGRTWMPWLGIIWILMPFSLLWATATGTLAVVGHHHY